LNDITTKYSCLQEEVEMRVAVAQLWQETNTFNPIPWERKHFEAGGLYFGADILEKLHDIGEIGGLVAAAEAEPEEVVLLPIIRAQAMAGGRVTAETLEFFRDKLVSGLRAVQPVDGVFLSLHGGMASEKEDDPEGFLLAAVREVVGDTIPVAAPLDHHANITELIIQSADVLVGYQEEPHDPFETGMRAAKLLFGLVKGEISPQVGWQKIPMIAPPDWYLTAAGPMLEWFDLAREMEQGPGVLSVSTFPVQAWLDVLELGWTAVVYTNGDAKLAQRLAARLADKAWELRARFWEIDRLPPDEVVRRAVDAEEGLIVISDGSDTVNGGAVGDSTCLLREMLKQKIECTALVPMVDPEVVEMATQAGVGSEITVWVGGKRDSVFNQPVEFTGTVAGVSDSLKTVIHWGTYDLGRAVLLEAGGIKMVVSDYAGVGGIQPDIYEHFGLDPAEAKMVVIKENNNFQYYSAWRKGLLRSDCPGLCGWDLRQFNWVRRPSPIYPLDEIPEWHAEPYTGRLGHSPSDNSGRDSSGRMGPDWVKHDKTTRVKTGP
jgi:microcystin degradation protein MlrC